MRAFRTGEDQEGIGRASSETEIAILGQRFCIPHEIRFGPAVLWQRQACLHEHVVVVVDHPRTEIIGQCELPAVARQSLDDRWIEGTDIELFRFDTVVQRHHEIGEAGCAQTLQADDVGQLAAGRKGRQFGPVIRKRRRLKFNGDVRVFLRDQLGHVLPGHHLWLGAGPHEPGQMHLFRPDGVTGENDQRNCQARAQGAENFHHSFPHRSSSVDAGRRRVRTPARGLQERQQHPDRVGRRDALQCLDGIAGDVTVLVVQRIL